MFLASKVISLLVAPGAVMILLLVAGLAFHRRSLVVLGTALLLCCLLLPVGAWPVRLLEDRFPQIVDPPAKVDGIVLLGGAIDDLTSEDRQTPSLNGAANRITTMAILARRYPDARLVFTGGSGDILQGITTEAPFAKALLTALGVAPDRLLLEGSSRTTWENAVETSKLVKPKPGETWLLVTSAAHMPRSIGVFRAAGWTDITAWPTGYHTRDSIALWLPSLTEQLALLDIAEHEWLGLLVYRLQGHSAALFPAP